MSDSKSHGRAYGNTQLTISLPVTLKQRITEEAAADGRTVSNWCVYQLRKVVARKGMLTLPDDAQAGPILKVAEDPLENQHAPGNGTEGK